MRAHSNQSSFSFPNPPPSGEKHPRDSRKKMFHYIKKEDDTNPHSQERLKTNMTRNRVEDVFHSHQRKRPIQLEPTPPSKVRFTYLGKYNKQNSYKRNEKAYNADLYTDLKSAISLNSSQVDPPLKPPFNEIERRSIQESSFGPLLFSQQISQDETTVKNKSKEKEKEKNKGAKENQKIEENDLTNFTKCLIKPKTAQRNREKIGDIDPLLESLNGLNFEKRTGSSIKYNRRYRRKKNNKHCSITEAIQTAFQTNPNETNDIENIEKLKEENEYNFEHSSRVKRAATFFQNHRPKSDDNLNFQSKRPQTNHGPQNKNPVSRTGKAQANCFQIRSPERNEQVNSSLILEQYGKDLGSRSNYSQYKGGYLQRSLKYKGISFMPITSQYFQKDKLKNDHPPPPVTSLKCLFPAHKKKQGSFYEEIAIPTMMTSPHIVTKGLPNSKEKDPKKRNEALTSEKGISTSQCKELRGTISYLEKSDISFTEGKTIANLSKRFNPQRSNAFPIRINSRLKSSQISRHIMSATKNNYVGKEAQKKTLHSYSNACNTKTLTSPVKKVSNNRNSNPNIHESEKLTIRNHSIRNKPIEGNSLLSISTSPELTSREKKKSARNSPEQKGIFKCLFQQEMSKLHHSNQRVLKPNKSKTEIHTPSQKKMSKVKNIMIIGSNAKFSRQATRRRQDVHLQLASSFTFSERPRTKVEGLGYDTEIVNEYHSRRKSPHPKLTEDSSTPNLRYIKSLESTPIVSKKRFERKPSVSSSESPNNTSKIKIRTNINFEKFTFKESEKEKRLNPYLHNIMKLKRKQHSNTANSHYAKTTAFGYTTNNGKFHKKRNKEKLKRPMTTQKKHHQGGKNGTSIKVVIPTTNHIENT